MAQEAVSIFIIIVKYLFKFLLELGFFNTPLDAFGRIFEGGEGGTGVLFEQSTSGIGIGPVRHAPHVLKFGKIFKSYERAMIIRVVISTLQIL